MFLGYSMNRVRMHSGTVLSEVVLAMAKLCLVCIMTYSILCC